MCIRKVYRCVYVRYTDVQALRKVYMYTDVQGGGLVDVIPAWCVLLEWVCVCA